MIYCGYQGCGKSTYCKVHPDTTIDLDSSNFPKVDRWEYNYIAVAHELELTTNKAVFISAHQCVINALRDLHIPFEVFVPAHDKEAWRHRLAFRYNNAPHQCNFNALADFEKNFEKDMAFYLTLPAEIVHYVSAKVVTNMEDYIA